MFNCICLGAVRSKRSPSLYDLKITQIIHKYGANQRCDAGRIRMVEKITMLDLHFSLSMTKWPGKFQVIPGSFRAILQATSDLDKNSHIVNKILHAKSKTIP